MNYLAKLSEPMACREFLIRMELLNCDLLRSIPVTDAETEQKMTMAEYIANGKTLHRSRAVYEVVILELAKYKHHPVVYIIDEHNEIWKNNKQGVDMWRIWTIGSGGPHGQRTYTIYSGSAHSPFELNLQSNMHKWVIRLQPLPRDSYKHFIEMKAFPLSPHLSALLKSHSVWTLDYLHHVTHGNPRETRYLLEYLFEKWLDNSESLEDLCEVWMFERQDVFFDEILNFSKKQDEMTRQLFHNFLKHWFGDPGAQGNPRSFFDTGLLYELIDNRGRCLKQFHSTSRAAYRAMLQYYFDAIVPTFLMDLKSSPLNGYRFETLVINHLKMSGFSGVGWRFGTPDVSEKLQLPPAVRFLELRETGSHLNTSGGPALYISPEERWNFPYLDVVLHVPAKKPKPQQLFFIQLTISTPKYHESKKGIIKSLDKLAPRLIEDITGIDHVSLDQDHSGNIQIELPKAHKGKLLVNFVLFTWKAKNEIDTKPTDKLPPDLLIVTKESLPFIPTTSKSEEDDVLDEDEEESGEAVTESEHDDEVSSDENE